jgi:GR25 family glycosyltransferase involved in LPS biosynthesis
MNILEYCLNNGIASYIVFEDDAQFKPGFDESFEAFVSDVPEDWQQAYIGGQLQHTHSHPTVKISPNCYRPYNVNRTHAFMVSRSGMLPIYQHISNLPFHAAEHIDHHLGRWHENLRNFVYCPAKWLVGQMGFSSNVSGKVEPVHFFADPESTALSHWLYDDPVCIVYRGTRQLLMSARGLLHAGNQIDANGFDVGLTLASRFSDPTDEIERWYGWIRGEIVRGNSKALPCLFHPRITDSMLEKCKFKTVTIAPNSLEDIRDFHAKFLTQR